VVADLDLGHAVDLLGGQATVAHELADPTQREQPQPKAVLAVQPLVPGNPGERLLAALGTGVVAHDLRVTQVEEFVTGVRRIADPKRVLAAVLFTDIVGSTEQAARLGDRRWRQLLDLHDELATRLAQEAGGRLIKITGDGILATFDGPARGIRCAADLRDELRGMGLQLRAGIHAGEVELRDGDIGGMAVHIAARVMAAAGPGEILASRTVRDLVVGSDLDLEDRGPQPLKGVEGSWQLFMVADAEPAASTPRRR
jgi:class 3 adenylate cyclase